MFLLSGCSITLRGSRITPETSFMTSAFFYLSFHLSKLKFLGVTSGSLNFIEYPDRKSKYNGY